MAFESHEVIFLRNIEEAIYKSLGPSLIEEVLEKLHLIDSHFFLSSWIRKEKLQLFDWPQKRI